MAYCWHHGGEHEKEHAEEEHCRVVVHPTGLVTYKVSRDPCPFSHYTLYEPIGQDIIDTLRYSISTFFKVSLEHRANAPIGAWECNIPPF